MLNQNITTEIIRSEKRIRTVAAKLKNSTLYIYAPARMPDHRLQSIIATLKKRVLKKQLKKEVNKQRDLTDIAAKLNKKYFNGSLSFSSIGYSVNQNSRYGVCHTKTKKILISHKLIDMPVWVRDYIIVHELAHLLVPNHSKQFYDVMSRYKLAERARGYLIAKGMNEDEQDLESNN